MIGRADTIAGQPWLKCLLLLALYALLNLAFHGLSLYFGYKRHFFGAELLLALLLFALGWKRLGAVALVVALVLELALGLSSVFYLFEKDQLWDMVEFLFEARLSYLAALALLPVVAAAAVWAAMRIQQGVGRRRQMVLVQVLVALGLLQGQWVLSSEAQTFFTPTLADRPRLLFGSAAHFMREVMVMNRLAIIGDRADEHAEYVPIQHPSATQKVWHGGLPSAHRVLLVVAEGWGLPKEPAVLERQIAPLRRSPHVQALRLDAIHARGATAAGELRELCWVVPTRLNFRKMTPEKVGDCLPAQLRRQGYATVGVHGSYRAMYRRTLWWPQIGLSETLFKEDIPLAQEPCHSFPGHCDRHLLDTVKSRLEGDKAFVYWLTLNSHMPYDRRDVAHYREALCDVWPAGEYWDQLCRYQNLHVQFFEGLAALAADEAMKGVEVMVVGDHAPLFNDDDSRERFSRDQVPVLHFVVR